MKLFNTLLVSTALLSASAIAQEQDLKPAIDTAKEINESAAKSQQKIDGITDQIDSKLQQFKVLKSICPSPGRISHYILELYDSNALITH